MTAVDRVQAAWDSVKSLPPIDFAPDEAEALLTALSTASPARPADVQQQAAKAAAKFFHETLARPVEPVADSAEREALRWPTAAADRDIGAPATKEQEQ